MSLKSDDADIRPASMYMLLGGNGDYYISIKEARENGSTEMCGMRISTSGGCAPSEVKIAVANLFRAMEKHKLNEID